MRWILAVSLLLRFSFWIAAGIVASVERSRPRVGYPEPDLLYARKCVQQASSRKIGPQTFMCIMKRRDAEENVYVSEALKNLHVIVSGVDEADEAKTAPAFE